jgi:hypothetical protein
MEALQVTGKQVRLRWHRENNRPVVAAGGADGSAMDQEEGR